MAAIHSNSSQNSSRVFKLQSSGGNGMLYDV